MSESPFREKKARPAKESVRSESNGLTPSSAPAETEVQRHPLPGRVSEPAARDAGEVQFFEDENRDVVESLGGEVLRAEVNRSSRWVSARLQGTSPVPSCCGHGLLSRRRVRGGGFTR